MLNLIKPPQLIVMGATVSVEQAGAWRRRTCAIKKMAQYRVSFMPLA